MNNNTNPTPTLTRTQTTAHQATQVDPACHPDVTERRSADADTFRSSNLVRYVVRSMAELKAANDADMAVIKSAKAGAAAAKVSRSRIREAKARVMVKTAICNPAFLTKSFNSKVLVEQSRRASVRRISRSSAAYPPAPVEVTGNVEMIEKLDAIHPMAHRLYLILREWSCGRSRIKFRLDNGMLARLIGPSKTVAAILEGLARIEQIVLVTPVTSGRITVDPCHPSSLAPEVLAEVEKLEREAQLAKEGADVQAC